MRRFLIACSLCLITTPCFGWTGETGSGIVSDQAVIQRTSLEATEVLTSDTLSNLYVRTNLGGTTNYASFDAGGVLSTRNVTSSRDTVNLGNNDYLSWLNAAATSTFSVGVSTNDAFIIPTSLDVLGVASMQTVTIRSLQINQLLGLTTFDNLVVLDSARVSGFTTLVSASATHVRVSETLTVSGGSTLTNVSATNLAVLSTGTFRTSGDAAWVRSTGDTVSVPTMFRSSGDAFMVRVSPTDVRVASTLMVSGDTTLANVSATNTAISQTLRGSGDVVFVRASIPTVAIATTLTQSGDTALTRVSASTIQATSTLKVSGDTGLATATMTTASATNLAIATSLATSGDATFLRASSSSVHVLSNGLFRATGDTVLTAVSGTTLHLVSGGLLRATADTVLSVVSANTLAMTGTGQTVAVSGSSVLSNTSATTLRVSSTLGVSDTAVFAGAVEHIGRTKFGTSASQTWISTDGSISYIGLARPRRTLWLSGGGAADGSSEASRDAMVIKGATVGNEVFAQNVRKFDGTAVEDAYWNLGVPDAWIGTSFPSVQVYWYVKSTDANVASWDVQAAALGDNVSPNTVTFAYPGSQTDTAGVSGTMMISPSFVVSVPSTWTSGNAAWIRVQKNSSNASDTVTSDAVLVGLRMEYEVQTNSDEPS